MESYEIEALYMTESEVAAYLGVSRGRVPQLARAGQITRLKGSVYDRASIEAYKLKRGNKKGGRYPKDPSSA